MIFHIAIAVNGIGKKIVLEFRKDFVVRFAQNIGQHIEPAPMRHTHDEFLDAKLGSFLDDRIQNRNQRFGTFE